MKSSLLVFSNPAKVWQITYRRIGAGGGGGVGVQMRGGADGGVHPELTRVVHFCMFLLQCVEASKGGEGELTLESGGAE